MLKLKHKLSLGLCLGHGAWFVFLLVFCCCAPRLTRRGCCAWAFWFLLLLLGGPYFVASCSALLPPALGFLQLDVFASTTFFGTAFNPNLLSCWDTFGSLLFAMALLGVVMTVMRLTTGRSGKP
jgi:hypothetical protein